MNTKELTAKVTELETTVIAMMKRIAELEERPAAKTRDYGPKSTNAMTDEIAWRILHGDRTRATHTVKQAAEEFGLSRGQVYSLGDYTFRHVGADDFHIDTDGNIIPGPEVINEETTNE